MVSPTNCICASCTSTDLWPWCSAYPVSLLYLYTRHFLTRISLPFLSNGRVSLSTILFRKLLSYSTRVVFNATGGVVVTYSKHHIFPLTETPWATPGPFFPVSFTMLGRRWGLIICYEGAWAEIRRDREIERSRDREIEQDWANDRETERQREE